MGVFSSPKKGSSFYGYLVAPIRTSNPKSKSDIKIDDEGSVPNTKHRVEPHKHMTTRKETTYKRRNCTMATCRIRPNVLLIGFIGFFVLLSKSSDVSSFTISRIQQPLTKRSNSIVGIGSMGHNEKTSVLRFGDLSTRKSTSQLLMANDDEGGTGVGIIAGLLLLVFVAGSVLPLVGTFGLKGNMSIADSVVTKQDTPGKLQNLESKQLSLSRSAIQEKLNSVPVFYLATVGSDGSTSMGTDIFMSYEDAAVASTNSPSSSVKGTTLDQVM